jgi:hypothetical protein
MAELDYYGFQNQVDLFVKFLAPLSLIQGVPLKLG